MSLLVSCQGIEKAFGAEPLFSGISLGIEAGEKLGLIGANGSGKSTLMKIFAGLEEPDAGEAVFRKGLSTAWLAQSEEFAPGASVESELNAAAEAAKLAPEVAQAQVARWVAEAGFAGPEQPVAHLSGGYKKRLSIAKALIQEPDLLLLDEPTNHLDLEGILWLEKLLQEAPFAFVLISHDRQLLETVPRRMIELGGHYPEGYLSVEGHWSDFLVAKEKFLEEQTNRQAVLSNKLRRETEWLRRGPKARSTKARYRVDEAAKLESELKQIKGLNKPRPRLDLDFVATGRQTRRLLEAYNLGLAQGGRRLFSKVGFKLTNGTRLGLLGPNGSGKTTLLKALEGLQEPAEGTIKTAEDLRVEVFDQHREELDPDLPLRNALSETGESVVYLGKELHIVTWAKKFLFQPNQLELPVGHLSGGEQARVQIARLMLRPADLLLLDEPTNDLDIPALEVLEESIQEFNGAVVLVTHDRALLNRVATQVLGLGVAEPKLYADFDQWFADQAPLVGQAAPAKAPGAKSKAKTPGLSFAEQKELGKMEGRIEKLEDQIAQLEARLAAPEMAQDPQGLEQGWAELTSLKSELEGLYARWADLEEKDHR